MRGPKTATEALSWIKGAVREGRYSRTKHLFDRMTDRTVSLVDLLTVIRRGARAEPYSDPPKHGGTCWRVHGQDLDGRKLAVGVEAYLDENERWSILCTVMELKKGK